MKVISVVLVVESRVWGDALVASLEAHADLRVHVMLGALEARLPQMEAVVPDIVLVDAEQVVGGGVALVERLRATGPKVRVVVMNLGRMPQDLIPLIVAGVSGFVLDTASADDLSSTLRSVAAGEKAIPPILAEDLLTRLAGKASAHARHEEEASRLTRREQKIMALIDEGLSNKEIADRLRISVHTVKSHTRNLTGKLSLHSRLQVAAYAHQSR